MAIRHHENVENHGDPQEAGGDSGREDEWVVVTPGDRADIIVAMLQANLSKNYPKVAGMILSGGLEPEAPVIKLVEGLDTVIPIVQVESGTFETVNTVGAVMSIRDESDPVMFDS